MHLKTEGVMDGESIVRMDRGYLVIALWIQQMHPMQSANPAYVCVTV